MLIKDVHLAIKQKLNKLSTNYGQEVTALAINSAINQAQYHWLDIRLKQEELNDTIQRELQHLIQTKPLDFKIVSKDLFYEYSVELPEDYYHYSNLKVKISDCIHLYSFLVENSNINSYLSNDSTRPDNDWEQSLITFKDNKLYLYTESAIESATLDYYKKPAKVDLKTQYKHLDGSPTQDVDLEFEDSSAYEIIDLATLLLAGNINDPNRIQSQSNLVQTFS